MLLVLLRYLKFFIVKLLNLRKYYNKRALRNICLISNPSNVIEKRRCQIRCDNECCKYICIETGELSF
jgi:hypothetical protein